MPSQSEALRKITEIFERNDIDYMLIGGWALPAYGHIRSTIDIDIAIIVKTNKKLLDLILELKNNDYQIPSDNQRLDQAMIQITDMSNMVEIELWLKPDGLVMDNMLLKKRSKGTIGGSSYWIIGPEDLIINKLSRPDRSETDEMDVITVLKNQKKNLDWKYLEKRAKKADIFSLLKTLEERIDTI